MSRNQIVLWLWVVSTILIALTWFKMVSMTFGWIGFALGLCASFLTWGFRPPRSTAPPPDVVDNHPAPKPTDRDGTQGNS